MSRDEPSEYALSLMQKIMRREYLILQGKDLGLLSQYEARVLDIAAMRKGYTTSRPYDGSWVELRP